MPDILRISSRQHPFVKRCRALASRREDGFVLLDGEHLVADALRAGVPLDGILTSDPGSSVIAAAADRAVPVYDAPAAVVAAASPVRTPSPVVAIGRWSPAPTPQLFQGTPLLVGLVDVQDPGNVGTIIRSADALGAAGVLALGATADPGGWKALRGAMGSTLRLPVARDEAETAIKLARRHGVRVAATVASGGMPIDAADYAGAWLLLVGNEGAGLPADLLARADRHLTVPMRPGVESLNVSVTAALAIWEAVRFGRAVPAGLS